MAHDAPQRNAPDAAADVMPWPALRRFVVVVVVFAALWTIPYASPALDSWRYYDVVDVGPLARALRFQAPSAQVAQVPGAQQGAAMADDFSDDELAALDPANAGGGGDAAGGAAADVDDGAADELTADAVAVAVAARADPDERTDGADPADPVAAVAPPSPPPLPAALQLASESLGTPPALIEAPERLAPYFAALVELAHGRRAKVRARHYGDSHLANDGISHVLRVLLQRRFGDGGHGFVIPRSRSKWFRHKGVRIASSEGWKSRAFIGGGFADGGYGYGGEASAGAPGDWVRVQTADKGHGATASHVELWWRPGGGATLSVELDGAKATPLKVDSRDDLHTVLVDGAAEGSADRPLGVRVRVRRGRPRVFGWVVERKAGVVWDSLGVVGARARRWLHADAAHLAAQVRHRKSDLIVLNYGANSRNDKISEAKYIRSLGEVLARLRPDKREPCLIIGPGDHGKRHKGQIVSDPKTVAMVGWQRKAADELGCAFLDARAMMGGDAAMGRWVKQGLGWSDYAHLTPRGQAALGRSIYQALMHGLAGYLEAGLGAAGEAVGGGDAAGTGAGAAPGAEAGAGAGAGAASGVKGGR